MRIATAQPLPSSREISGRTASLRSSLPSLWFPVFVILFAVSPAFSDDTASGSPTWPQRCAGVRTSYNPHFDLRSDLLTLETNDPRWPAFLSWVQAQQIATSTLTGL